ncbi:MAG TPA: hypothetical protein VN899_05560 [Stellaceae bacterium]|nr:hypothetical protein [Stellaceae bacterium]
MLTLLQKWLLIAFLAACLVGACFGEWLSSSKKPQAINSPQATAYEKPDELPWYRSSAVWTAIFTGLLTLSTAGLWTVTRTAANAAKTAAESLPVVERAYVYPIVISGGDLAGYIEDSENYYPLSLTKHDIPRPERTEITFRIKNYGKTPAILKAVYAAFGVYPLSMEEWLTIPEPILGAMETTRDLAAVIQAGLSQNQAARISGGTMSLSFSGEIYFEDIWGIKQSTRFIFVWDKRSNSMVLESVSTKTHQKNS